MKTIRVLPLIFAVCFLLGIGFIATNPAQIQAANDPIICNPLCDEIVCKDYPDCGWDYAHHHCYMTYYSPFGCIGPFDCKCSFVGCGLPCRPT